MSSVRSMGFFVFRACSRDCFLVTMANRNRDWGWRDQMLKLVSTAGYRHVAHEGFNDVNKVSCKKSLAYFLAEDEVRMGNIQKALSFRYRSCEFMVAPDGLGPQT